MQSRELGETPAPCDHRAWLEPPSSGGRIWVGVMSCAVLRRSQTTWRLDRAACGRDRTACCTAAHPVALCALQGPLQCSGPLPSWCEPTRLARCAWGANWTVLMRCAANSALSKQQRRQFSATAARAEYRIHPQPRRKSCNGLILCGFCGDATAYAVGSIWRERPVILTHLTPALSSN